MMETLPIYQIRRGQRSLPCLVTIQTRDGDGDVRYLPIVRRSVAKMADHSGRIGLAQLRIDGALGPRTLALIGRAFEIGSASLLLECNSAELSETVMDFLDRHFELTLLAAPVTHTGD